MSEWGRFARRDREGMKPALDALRETRDRSGDGELSVMDAALMCIGAPADALNASLVRMLKHDPVQIEQRIVRLHARTKRTDRAALKIRLAGAAVKRADSEDEAYRQGRLFAAVLADVRCASNEGYIDYRRPPSFQSDSEYVNRFDLARWVKIIGISPYPPLLDGFLQTAEKPGTLPAARVDLIIKDAAQMPQKALKREVMAFMEREFLASGLDLPTQRGWAVLWRRVTAICPRSVGRPKVPKRTRPAKTPK